MRFPSAPPHHRAISESAGRQEQQKTLTSRKHSAAHQPTARPPPSLRTALPPGGGAQASPQLQERRGPVGLETPGGVRPYPAHVRWRFLSVQKTRLLFLDLQAPTSHVSKSTSQKYIHSFPRTHRVLWAAEKEIVLTHCSTQLADC